MTSSLLLAPYIIINCKSMLCHIEEEKLDLNWWEVNKIIEFVVLEKWPKGILIKLYMRN